MGEWSTGSTIMPLLEKKQSPMPAPWPDVPPPPGLTAEHVNVRGQSQIVLSFPIVAPDAPAGLTAAERAVAVLVLEGRTDAEIAAIRGVSKRTVGNQVASIFRKLGVGSRVELAARSPAREGDAA
jgi:DNA-binding CsgD family transcriptional regulator